MTQNRHQDQGRLAGLDGVLLTGVLLTLAGYLLPWFRKSSSHQWWFSGWEYASLSSGGGWTLWTFAFLAVAAVVSFWARTSVDAAMTALAAGIGTLVLSLTVVAASFSTMGDRGNLNSVADRPFGLGLPILAVGLGLLIARACRDISRAGPG